MKTFRLRILGDIGVEVWQDIPTWEGFYQASNYGRIKSVDRVQRFKNRWGFECDKRLKGQIINPRVDRYGYYYVNLQNRQRGKYVKVHRLVAETFIPNPEKYPVINHKDECKTNNMVGNIEWCTVAYNNSYGERNKKATEKHKKPLLQFDLNGNFIKEWASLSECCNANNYWHSAVSKCCLGQRKKAYNYIWKYKKDVS